MSLDGTDSQPIPPWETFSSPGSEAFCAKYFPGTGVSDWNNWRWQLRHRLRDLESTERIFRLSDSEREAICRHRGTLPLGITPYYASLLDPADPTQGLRRTKIPSLTEYERAPDERDDPLGEEAHSPVPGIVHTYPDKVLFLVTDFCATYCRYCTRARMVGGGEMQPKQSRWEQGLAYIRQTPAIRDVLLSGGDPLILSDRRLGYLLDSLAAIPHVEFIRIGTKVPAVLPQRITSGLLAHLQNIRPLYMSLHFVHPDELTPEVALACNALADAGVVMGGQTVLLKGVNDEANTLKRLNLGLLKLRVTPYYLHQCDAIRGSQHFRTPIQAGLDILEALHGHTTGYAVPHYMIDAPGGGGKVPIGRPSIVGRDGQDILLRNYQGKLYRYRDPTLAIPESNQKPEPSQSP